jgi:hypothetical protein
MSRPKALPTLRTTITMWLAICVFTLGLTTAAFYRSWWIAAYVLVVSFLISATVSIRRK